MDLTKERAIQQTIINFLKKTRRINSEKIE